MGTFGVNVNSVSQRTREIGVRVALGATPHQVQRMVVRGGAILTAAGLAVGLPGRLAFDESARGHPRGNESD